MIQNYQELIDAFAEAAQLHAGINSFDAGDREYFFDPGRDVEYPHVFLRFSNFGQAVSRTTLNAELVVLDDPASELTYGEGDFTNPNGVVLTAPFNWDRNRIGAVDTAKTLAHEVITLVKRGAQQGKITISETYTGNDSGSRTTSAKGWAIPLAVSFENPFDITAIPTR